LQTKEFYALHYNANNFNWVVNVLNKKYVEIFIKTKGFSGYVPVFEYISNLQKGYRLYDIFNKKFKQY